MPDYLSKFNCILLDYFHYSSSSMSSAVASGVLRGRPFGVVSFLISKDLIKLTTYMLSERNDTLL